MLFLNTRWLIAINLLVAFFLFSHNTRAQEPEHFSSPSINSAISQKLWNNTEWINLLHYAQSSENEYTSNVVDQKFFIAEDGNVNPRGELIATLNAFYSEDTSNPDNHALCQFKARAKWLKKHLPEELINLPVIECPLYKEWRDLMPAHKVSLIFPAYHLNSPSSMFGHTLLRIDHDEDKNSSKWLSMAVNFGANINNDDNSILYAFKGLAGGYPGLFIVTPYFNKIKEYNRYENRDIWEYPLNLTPAETEDMILHLWELKEVEFKYYFFDENCSYRLLELLQVARPGLKLTEQFGLTAIPVDTVRSIENANLINGVVYRPSQATNVQYLLSQLNSAEQDFAFKLSEDAKLINSQSFKQYDQKTQNLILETAYHYLRYKQNDTVRSDSIANNSYQLLLAINSKPEFKSTTASLNEQQRPENGHLSKRFAITAGRDNEQNYAQFDLRMSFHSLEDSLKGFLEGAQINIGSLSIRATEEEAQLQQLDLINIFSLTPRNNFFQPLSWRVSAGLEQQIINSQDHLTGHVTAGAGVAYKLWPHSILYGMITARLESSSQHSQAIEPALGISTGLLQHFPLGTAHLEFSGEEFYHDEFRHRVEFTQNINLQRNHAIQLSVLRQHQTDLYFTEAQISYHYFFH